MDYAIIKLKADVWQFLDKYLQRKFEGYRCTYCEPIPEEKGRVLVYMYCPKKAVDVIKYFDSYASVIKEPDT
jgi:hypothetical protein